MELQWPLILFTTFIAWSAGLFASQCVLALKGEAPKVQIPAWIASATLLVIGGIAVFFHLEHWTRIFNGFGHLSSGITQELIAIVLLAVVAVIYFALLRKSEDKVPAWIAILGIATAIVLVFVMAHSYVMAARPAWDSVLWILAVLGNACVLGPATLVLVCFATNEKDVPTFTGLMTLGGAAINAVASAAYLLSLTLVSSKFSNVGYYFDPSYPTEGMLDITVAASSFGPDSIMFSVIALIAVLAAVVAAFMGKKGKWELWGTVTLIAGLIAAICVRVVFYQMGFSAFAIY